MERKGYKGGGKKEDNFSDKNKEINKDELILDDLFTQRITNDSNLLDEADDSSSYVGKEDDVNIRKRQIRIKVKKANSTINYMEVRFYIFLVLLICFYALLVNIMRKGLGLVSVAHRFMRSQDGSISM
ncbi:Uncharacterized protein PCOAH_00002410 [Plasmodium coatneyi]|uniref:Uncharacterized protein n=1 Tax=Plasmodium coatneyi TaxID=208452 RepID=A0A1B1DTS5_9APIC|nr:Uncharacterized protein PCOAH_00002410 [Plasmodium coatneyi]ANQ06049.1 Uncharacterized protein PCOAH_00002410 [Plasmodium coatneyi]